MQTRIRKGQQQSDTLLTLPLRQFYPPAHMNRRKWIMMSAGCFAALVCDHGEASLLSAMLDVSLRDATDAFDHILLGASDLDLGIRWVEERTGMRAKFGGNHPGAGTRNALLTMGDPHRGHQRCEEYGRGCWDQDCRA